MATAACFCRKCLSNMVGIGQLSSSKLAVKRPCREMRGKRAQSSRPSLPRFSGIRTQSLERSSAQGQKKTGDGFPVSGSECIDLACENLLRLVHLHGIARMNVFQGKDNHGGGCRGRNANDNNLTHTPPGQIAHVNYRSVGLGEHVGVDRRLSLLSVLSGGCLK